MMPLEGQGSNPSVSANGTLENPAFSRVLSILFMGSGILIVYIGLFYSMYYLE